MNQHKSKCPFFTAGGYCTNMMEGTDDFRGHVCYLAAQHEIHYALCLERQLREEKEYVR